MWCSPGINTGTPFIFDISSLQCYSCTSFEKNEFENFSILIFYASLVADLSIIPEGKIYTYSVNDLGLKKFLQYYGIYGHFTVCRQNIMP